RRLEWAWQLSARLVRICRLLLAQDKASLFHVNYKSFSMMINHRFYRKSLLFAALLLFSTPAFAQHPEAGLPEEETQQRQVKSPYGVVAADEARVSQVGAHILEQGGNAADAAAASMLALGVV